MNFLVKFSYQKILKNFYNRKWLFENFCEKFSPFFRHFFKNLKIQAKVTAQNSRNFEKSRFFKKWSKLLVSY